MQTSFITRRGHTHEVLRDEKGRLAKFVQPVKEQDTKKEVKAPTKSKKIRS